MAGKGLLDAAVALLVVALVCRHRTVFQRAVHREGECRHASRRRRRRIDREQREQQLGDGTQRARAQQEEIVSEEVWWPATIRGRRRDPVMARALVASTRPKPAERAEAAVARVVRGEAAAVAMTHATLAAARTRGRPRRSRRTGTASCEREGRLVPSRRSMSASAAASASAAYHGQ